MEVDIKSFKRDILKAQNKSTKGIMRTFDEAIEDIRAFIQDDKKEEIQEKLKTRHTSNEIEKRDKAYLRDKEKEYRKIITECINANQIRVSGFENRMNEFTDLAVSEFVGYSALEDAFKNDDVSDIFVINHNTIFVEQNGINVRYPYNFRNERHCENTIKRFITEDKKELNNGANKIVNFEIFEDRGCAISPVVATKGYSVTLRKHKEDHITHDDLLKGGLLNEEIAHLLGLLIDGETNIICAGITGSGKTTTIRALLDYNLQKSNKRVLVCEDTKELFLKYPHTLDLVTAISDDKSVSVDLRDLIYTALRLKPKYIVVGEVRGAEAEAAVEAMETGHSTIFTMHAGTPFNAINRLVTKYLMQMPSLGTDVVERIVGSAVDYIFIQDAIPGIGRRITSLDEISYNFESKRVEAKNIFYFDFEKEDWVWSTRELGELQVNKMLRRGVKLEDLKPYMGNKGGM